MNSQLSNSAAQLSDKLFRKVVSLFCFRSRQKQESMFKTLSSYCFDGFCSQDSLEDELVAIHQEMEIYQNQPLILDKLQLKKESQQNQLITIRGELSQASSVSLLTHGPSEPR